MRNLLYALLLGAVAALAFVFAKVEREKAPDGAQGVMATSAEVIGMSAIDNVSTTCATRLDSSVYHAAHEMAVAEVGQLAVGEGTLTSDLTEGAVHHGLHTDKNALAAKEKGADEGFVFYHLLCFPGGRLTPTT